MIIARRPGWVRILVLVTAPLITISGLYLFFLAIASKSIQIGAAGLIVFGFGIFTPILAFRYRLVLTERSVRAIDVRVREIEYLSISRAEMRYGKLVLSSPQGKITITRDITERETVLRYIAAKLTNRNDVRFEGDAEDLFAYFGKGPAK